MKKVYKLKNLGCANCANVMQDKIAKLDGVVSSKVNFMLSKLTIEVESADSMPSKEKLQEIIHSVENYCEIL